MSQLHKGQRVRVTFEGTIYSVSNDAVYVEVADVGGYQFVSAEHVTVLDPAHWPPRVGDIWEAEGHEYVIRNPNSVSKRHRPNIPYTRLFLVVSPLDDTAPTMGGRPEELKAHNPKLIRRRGGFHR